MKGSIALILLSAGICAPSFLYCSFSCHNKNSALVIKDSASFLIDNNIENFSGTIEKESNGSISGSNIHFDDGIFRDGNRSLNTTTTIDGNGSVTMAGNHELFYSSGISLNSINVSSFNNKIVGQISLSNPITLFDPSTTLTLAISGNLNQNIALESGKIILEDDLRISDDYKISGSGKVDLGNKSVAFGQKELTFSEEVSWQNDGTIIFSGNVNLSNQWIFFNDVSLEGNGNTLDLSSNGSLVLRNGATLRINNVNIKGLSEIEGALIFGNDTSKIVSSNSTFNLSGNVTTTSGGIYVNGPTTVVTGSYSWTFENGGTMTVDRQTLWYDTLGSCNCNNISPSINDNINMVLINNGRISQVQGSTSITSTGDMSFSQHTFPSPASPMNLEKSPEDPPGQKTITVDGNGYSMFFNNFPGTLLVVGDNVDAVFTNVIFKDFLPSHVQLGSGSSLIFGTGTTLQIGGSEDLSQTWSFDGTTVLDCQNRELTLNANHAISALPGATLTIRNASISSLGGSGASSKNNLHCCDSASKIILDNVNLTMESDFSFTVGNIDIEREGSIKGRGKNFAYTSSNNLTIKTDATLFLDFGVTFSYDSDSAANDKIVFESTTSNLHLKGCTLHSTHTGVKFATGHLIVDDKVRFEPEASSNNEAMVFDSGLNFDVLATGIADIAGLVVYE